MVSRWTPYTLPTIPGVQGAIDAASDGGNVLVGLLESLSDAMSVVAMIASTMTDPLNAVMGAAVEAVQDMANGLVATLETGAYVYVDKGPIFRGEAPDGLVGWLRRFSESLDDTGDHERPMFGEGSNVTLIFLVAGSETLEDMIPKLRTLSALLSIPAVNAATEEQALEWPTWNETQLSTPPDWMQIPLIRRCPPLGGVARILQKAAGFLSVGKSYTQTLDNLSNALELKALALANVLTEIDQVMVEIEELIASEGLWALVVNADGMEEALEFIETADNVPPWSTGAYVGGVCLLGGSADFAAVVELLVGGEE